MKMKKTLMVVLAVILIASLTIGSTLAYFAWQSETVTNSFKVSGDGIVPVDPDPGKTGIEVEPSWDPDEEHDLTPNAAYAKDPQVGLSEESLDAWVIFKVVEKNNYLDNGDQAVLWEATDDVVLMSKETDAETGDVTYYYGSNNVVKAGEKVCLFTDIGNKNPDGSVLVNPAMTQEQKNKLLGEGLTVDYVQLVITAYAIDATVGATAAEAFNNAVAAGNITK